MKIVVTGASRGIGRGLAEALAGQGHELFLVARDVARLEEARSAIATATGNSAIRTASADLSRMSEVRGIARVIREAWDSLDVLVNNHAALFPQRQESDDGLEMNFALNYLSVVVLTRELLALLKRAPRGRVVNVAAEVHRMASLDLGDLQYRKGYESVQAYCRAKLMVVMFTRDEATRPEAGGVGLVAVHPGSMYTDALRDMRREYTRLTGKTEFPQAVDVREGIAPLQRLVCGEMHAGDSGSYFVLAERTEPSTTACDAGLATELRHRTMALLETL